LGNTRLVITDKTGTGTPGVIDVRSNTAANEILQENHYYAFGMAYEGKWLMNDAGVRDNAYQYNGKEINADFGLNWNDYGARWYDPSVGRWNAVDAMVEKYSNFNGYLYTLNNPVNLIDFDGNDIYTIMPDGSIVLVKNEDKQDQFFLGGKGEQLPKLIGSFDKNEKGLIKLPSKFTFKNHCEETCGFTVKEGNEERSYIRGDAFAALLGVLGETATNDLTINGFSLANGKSKGPSTSHKNGINGDLRYLKTDFSGRGGLLTDDDFDRNRQDRFNKSLNKFGWKSLLSENYTPNGGNEQTIVDEATHYNKSRHNNHLHIQGFKPKIIVRSPINPIYLKY
jgi:RHS repeat-associated protein